MGVNSGCPFYDGCFSPLYSLLASVTFAVVVLCEAEFLHLIVVEMPMDIEESRSLIIFKA